MRAARQPAITLALPFKPPYDWPQVAGFLARRAIPGVEHVSTDGYARTISLEGWHGTITVRPTEAGAHALTATISFPNAACVPLIARRIRCIFDLDADSALIGAHLSRDPHLARLVAARPGMRVPGAWDGFELAVRAILGQQISVGRATQLAGKLVAAYGTAFGPRPLSHLFPSAEQLIDVELAATLGMPRSRAAAITALARAAAADPTLFAADQGDAAIPRLMRLPGIGAWTAEYIAMRALGEKDAFPAADIGLLRVLATEAGRPTPAELSVRAEAWRPWRAYAVLHLWASDSVPRSAVADDGM